MSTSITSVDARGKSCPLPIVLTAKAMRELSVGQELVVLADDRAFAPDIRAWCDKTGHQLLALEVRAGYSEATLRKTR